MKFRCGLLGVVFAVALQAQMQMNVEQLADFVRSELALQQHSDKQIAAAVRKIHLTERLTDKTITDLEAQNAGSKTLDALRMLRDETANLKQTAPADATSSPATARDTTLSTAPPTVGITPKPVQPPPPDSVHQQQILDSMKQYALTYAQSLPNYICVRVDRRFYDPSGSDRYRSLGTVLAKVSYNGGQEHYKVYSDSGRIVDPEMGGLGVGGGGARSSGEFAAMMSSIFEPRSDAEFGWDHWGKVRGRVMAVFNYFIDSGHSNYTISYGSTPGDDQHIVTAYKGLIYADANTGEIDRISFSAINIPSSFPVRKVDELVDYDLVSIGDQQAVLPIRALLKGTTLHETSKNEIEFRNYHKYGADVKIQYDLDPNAPPPAPLPASKTDEQPLNSAAKPEGNSAAPGQTKQPAAKPAAPAASSANNPWTLPTPPPPPPPQQ